MPSDRTPGEASVPQGVIVKYSFSGLERRGFDVVHGPSPAFFICRACVRLCVDISSGPTNPRRLRTSSNDSSPCELGQPSSTNEGAYARAESQLTIPRHGRTGQLVDTDHHL
jgi:hypothetical protein